MTSVIHRHRISPWKALPMDEADIVVLHQAEVMPAETVTVGQVQLGDVLAEDVSSLFNVPDVRTSIKDGYAVIATDQPGHRKVIGNSTAGLPAGVTLKSGECIRVSTGAAIPDGATAVVMVEHTKIIEHTDDEELVVDIGVECKDGQDIRLPGSDCAVGALLLARGTVIRSAELGILYGSGMQKVSVFKKPRCAVMSTGNEVHDALTRNVPTAHIRDTNRPQILSIVKEEGAIAIDCGIVPDDRASVVSAFSAALSACDVLISSGGVSMGEKDLIKSVLQDDFKFEIHFGRVWMKPGLPSTFATGIYEGKKKLVFALPGNPVSSWVCAHLFAVPAIRKMRGITVPSQTKINVKINETINLDLRPEFRRAFLKPSAGDDLPTAVTTGNQISSRLMSLQGASVLLVLPGKSDSCLSLAPGTVVQALIVGQL